MSVDTEGKLLLFIDNLNLCRMLSIRNSKTTNDGLYDKSRFDNLS